MQSIPQTSGKYRNIAIRALVIFIPSTFILAYILFSYHRLELQEDDRQISTREFNHLQVLESSIKKDLEEITSDLMFLHSILEFGIESNSFTLDAIPANIQRDFLMFSKAKGLYDQLRVIDKSGMEQIRVNYSNESASFVPKTELQDKSQRYYFKETMLTEKDEIFISPFDLNVEHGSIETPLKPMIRFGLKIFDAADQVQGIILANYFGNQLLNNFTENEDQCQGTCMLINNDGYYLFHPDSLMCWGFMFPDKKNMNFAKSMPAFWDDICANESGQYFTEAGLLTFKSIYPMSVSGHADVKWILATHIAPNRYLEIVHHDELEHALTLIILLSMMTTISILIGVITERRYQNRLVVANSEKMHRALSTQLQESNSIKELLLDVITHDLKNPAGVIYNMSEMLHEELPDNDMVELIAKSSESLQKVMDHSTTLSKISLGEEIETHELNLTPVLLGLVNELDSQFTVYEMDVKTQLPEALLVNANPIISEIFQNFLTNTIRYASEGKHVLIRGAQVDDNIFIEIIDEGNTIPEKHREEVFLRKFKMDKESRRGTGLGLAIVKRIATMHHAEVGVLANSPRGNIFWLRIPAAT